MEKFNCGNPVRRTTLAVLAKAGDVSINYEKVEKIAEEWSLAMPAIPKWSGRFHLKTSNKNQMLTYIFLLDALNFCFWSASPKKKKWRVNYKGNWFGGYYGLSISLKKFFEENPKLANWDYFSRISYKDFSEIFSGEGELQLLKERWKITRALSQFMIKKYKGNSADFIKSAKHSLSALIPKIANELPAFNDLVRRTHHKRVYFWKRAQILATDLIGAFGGKGYGHFKDLEYLTALADYRVPQILSEWGIMEYSKNLKEKIKKGEIIKAGSQEEIEIRSATIWAVEYLRDALARRGKKIYSFEIDWILWNKTRNTKMKLPHHLTKTTFY